MTMAFDRSAMRFDDLTTLAIVALDTSIKPWDTARLRRYKELWNFYEGFHWENVPFEDKPQVTVNYSRRFVDKFVAFLIGDNGFTITVDESVEDITLPFLNDVWDYNNKMWTLAKIAQTGSVSGDAYVRVYYQRPGTFEDPFGEFPKGKIQVISLPSHIVFPVWDSHDRTKMLECTIKYPVFKSYPTIPALMGFSNNQKWEQVLYKQIWTHEYWQVWEGQELINEGPNPYGFIPIVHIPNYPLANSNYGVSDIEDQIPLNIELNEKMSDISEIIDYHSSPITIVKGAKVGQLEKGANKVWGNLPKESDVYNLQMTGDLGAATNYINTLRMAMFEVSNIPEIALGSNQAISNTSGIALQIMNMPIIERTRMKRVMYGTGIELVNKMILAVAFREQLLTRPPGIDPRVLFKTTVQWDDALPKDKLLELEQIQLEMNMGLESKRGALERLNNGHEGEVNKKLDEIQQEKLEDFKQQLAQQKMEQEVLGQVQSKDNDLPSGKNAKGQPRKINSGVNNGPEPQPNSNNAKEKIDTSITNVEGKLYSS